LVSQVREQTHPVGQSNGAVQSDRFPDAVDVAARKPMFCQEARGEVRSFDFEPRLALRERSQSEVVHHSGREEQTLVVVGVVHRPFEFCE
jgi:hypothetical protein